MATPSWFNQNEYLNAKLAQLQTSGEKDPSGQSYTSISQLSDVLAAAGLSAFEHYNAFGSKEGLDPSSAFKTQEYCEFKLRQLQTSGTDGEKSAWAGKTWQDVQYSIQKAGLSVGEHYMQYGAVEGVSMCNAFDTNAYLTAKLAALVADPATKAAWEGKNTTDVAKAILAAGLDPYTHYKTYGDKPNEVKVDDEKFVSKDPVKPADNPGKTFPLTTGVDEVNGTAGNDTIMAGIDASGAANKATLTTGDSIDGGAGTDTLKVFGGSFNGVEMKNVEVIELNSVLFSGSGANSFDKTLDLTGLGDVQTVRLAKTMLDPASGSFSVSGLTDKDSVVLVGNNTGADMKSDHTITTYNLNMKYADAATTAVLGLENAKILDGDATAADKQSGVVATFSGKGLNTVKVQGSQADADQVIVLKQAGGAAITTLNVNATGDLNIIAADASNGNLKGLTVIDASNSKGDVRIVAEGLDKTATITGGTGNDVFEFKDEIIARKHVINGGAGDDTLVLNLGGSGFDGNALAQGTYDYLNSANVSGIETVSFWRDGAAANQLDIDMGKLNATHIISQNKAVISNIDTTDTIGLGSGQAVGAVDVLRTLKVSEGNKDGVVNVEAHVVDAVNYSWINDTNASSGSNFKVLNITGEGNVGMDNTNGATGVTIDASKMEAGAKFWFEGAVDKLDTLTFGAGADTYQMSSKDVLTFDVINGFGKGDKVMIDTTLASSVSGASVYSGTVTEAQVTGVIAGLLAASGDAVTLVQVGKDVYIVANDGNSSANDGVVHLTGVNATDLTYVATDDSIMLA